MRTKDGEPKLMWFCALAVRYLFRVARNIANQYVVERGDQYTEMHPHISVTKGEVFIDDFPRVDRAIKVARNDLNLAGTRCQYTSGRDKEISATYLAKRAPLEGTNTCQILF